MAFKIYAGTVSALGSLVAALGVGAIGCSADMDQSGSGPTEGDIGTWSAALGKHVDPNSAETVVTTTNPAGWQVIMSYNDDDPGLVVYGNGTRYINPNASLMGFSGWSFVSMSPTHSGKVRPPTDWSALWGDPSITRNRADVNRVYLSNLAIPTNKFPSSGQIVGSVAPGNLPANMCDAYVGGACIARSSDGGQTFSLASSDCVRRTSASCPFGVFYDGSDLETNPNGRVFAAYNDVHNSRIDVYMALTSTGSFSRITGLTSSATNHPRLKWGPGGLYLLFMGGSTLKLARYSDGETRLGTWSTPVTVATGVAESDIVLSDRSIRLGPPYSFDIGPNEAGGTDEIRILFSVLDSAQKTHIQGVKCTTGATITCSHPSTWDTGSSRPGGDQWNPLITHGVRPDGVHTWGVSFWDRANFPTGNQVELFMGILTSFSNQNSMVFSKQENAQAPCSDLRGYWGDYDNMLYFPTLKSFYRGFTDSSHASPCIRAPFSGVYNSALTFRFVQ